MRGVVVERGGPRVTRNAAAAATANAGKTTGDSLDSDADPADPAAVCSCATISNPVAMSTNLRRCRRGGEVKGEAGRWSGASLHGRRLGCGGGGEFGRSRGGMGAAEPEVGRGA